VWASELGMGVGRFSRLVIGVGMLAMPDAGLNTTRRTESVSEARPGAGVVRLLVPCLAVGVFIECLYVAERMEVPR